MREENRLELNVIRAAIAMGCGQVVSFILFKDILFIYLLLVICVIMSVYFFGLIYIDYRYQKELKALIKAHEAQKEEAVDKLRFELNKLVDGQQVNGWSE